MKYDGSGNIQVAVATSDFAAVDMNLKSLGVGVNGASGTEGIVTLRNGANPGTTATLSYTKWADLEAATGIVKCDGSGNYSAITDSSTNWDLAYYKLTNNYLLATSDNALYTNASTITLAEGNTIFVKVPNADSTGSITINFNSAGAKKVYKTAAAQAGAADFKANSINPLSWNSSLDTTGAWQMVGGGVSAASDTVAGIVELAIASEVTTGTSTTLAVTPDALSGSDYGKRVFTVHAVYPTAALATGDNQAYFPVPSEIHGWNLNSVQGTVYTASTAGGNGAVVINLLRTRTGTGAGSVEMLATALTLDQDETTSLTAATAFALSATPANYAVSANATSQDVIGICIDTAGTSTCGLDVKLTFILP